MTRRTILDDRNSHSVKWTLVAAAIALSAGLFAEYRMNDHVDEPPAVVQELTPAPAESS